MDRKLLSIRINCIALVCALVVQYALGMYVNLYISFPSSATIGQLWEFAWSQWPLAAHIVLAMLIVLGGIVLLVRALLLKNKRWVIASSIGLAAVLLAGVSGSLFISSQTNAYSYAMSFLFLVAVLSYAWGLSSNQPA